MPKSLRGNVHPFNYNDLSELERLIKTKSIGVIKMEVYRNIEPKNKFLEKIRDLASSNGIVLILMSVLLVLENDLVGFVKYGVEPDIAVYGKTLGNGYAVSAVVGCESVMQSAQSTFISSTFWTERIGSVAALKTLEIMEKEEPWEHAMAMGHYMRLIWQQVAENNNIEIKISGLPAISSFSINSNNALAYKTLITQESLKYGYFGGEFILRLQSHIKEK